MKYLIKILAYSFLLCIPTVFANYCPACSPFSAHGGPASLFEEDQFRDEFGNLKDNPDTNAMIINLMELNFNSNALNSLEQRVNTFEFQLKEFGLDENYDLRDRVLSQLALRLAHRDYNFESEEMKYGPTDYLDIFESVLESSSVQLPSNISNAKELKRIVDEAGDDHKKFLSEVDYYFSGEEKKIS